MDLVVFDLDGTLLNADHFISARTGRVLQELTRNEVAYTVATGRSIYSARTVLNGHVFGLPQIFRNGVMTWNPSTGVLSRNHCLTLTEIEPVITVMLAQDLSPFIATVEQDDSHRIYHPPVTQEVERRLADYFTKAQDLTVKPLAELSPDAAIVGISGIGDRGPIDRIAALIEEEPHLVAYSGNSFEGDAWRWIDIHHIDATKGNAVTRLRKELGATQVLCFGDGQNDLSMFEIADESFAPANAADEIKSRASSVIGHHDQDGVANYLVERYSLQLD
ncbi:MAG: HAD-IIB family hydrolase [Pseudomonadota bacterium]